MFELREPPMNMGKPEEAIRELQRYLFEMKRALEAAMGQTEAAIKQAKTQSAEAVQRIAGEKKSPQSTFLQLKDLIIKSADIVEAISSRAVVEMAGRYVAQSDFGTYREETNSKLEATDRGIQQNYRSIQELTSMVAGISDAQIEMNAYIRTGLLYEDDSGVPRYGVEIGEQAEKDGALVFRKFARLSSDRLSFFDENESEVAYVSDRKLHITEADILVLNGDTISARRLQIGDYMFFLQNDGHLTIL